MPRLSVSVGDRVQEEVVKRNDYKETEVDNMFTRGRNRKKVRQMNDDEDKEAETPAHLAQENAAVRQDSNYCQRRVISQT